MALYDQNWDINSYNKIYGNTGNTDARFPGEGDLYKQFDEDMNFRGPNPFGSFRSGIGSFYNQQAPQLNTLDPMWQHQLRMQGIDRGNIENKSMFSGLTTPIMAGLNYLKDKIPYKGAERPAWDYTQGGWLTEEEQDKLNARGGYYSEVARQDRRQRKRVIDMMKRRDADKGYSEKNLQKLIDQGYGTGPNVVTTTGGASTYTGPPTKSFNPQQFAKAGRRADRPGGFTDPGKGSYGPHMAYGGRIGYENGELVEDEYMAEATPQGMMEENIEEVRGEPSREQLEAIALEIFRLPLEQLNEQQLEVVYQAAMEQEPSEEEVQFAAQEGPGEGIASLV